MTIAWVIGGNGLLGSSLLRVLRRTGINLFTPAEPFRWDNEPELTRQLKAAVKYFASFVSTEMSWEIYWAAGMGTMSSTEHELAVETKVLTTLLNLVESEPKLIEAKGCFVFASSAGAIYAGRTDESINENTPAAPTTPYAHAKLRQESLISAVSSANSRITALIARISTLYGPGQAAGKQQGLITQIARRILRNQPIQIYVPLDTIRDYISADDAAAVMVATLRLINGKAGVFTKIIASEQPTTIAEIVSIYKRIARRTPRIFTSANKLSGIYSRRIQFHSIAILPNEQIPRTSLLIGISQVMAAERSAYAQSQR